ncbi:MAG: trkD [Ramlibacter sp.]|nr:trkD [Ramlibacter sp.]
MNALTLPPPIGAQPDRTLLARGAITVAALGVVYGDIGTSPLYALKECFNPAHGVPLTHAAVLGILSMIFWSLMLVVSLKYVVFILRADYDGEGGILALQALAKHAAGGAAAGPIVIGGIGALGLLGAAMFYGDSLITPAVSVLSAVEGLEVATPLFKPFVVPVTLGIVIALYLVQKFGTGAVGKVFGPVMVVWFVILGGLGLAHILRVPSVLQALDPSWSIGFFQAHPAQSIAVLGSVFLAVTGGEALYADMGHFGAAAIRRAWFFVALPALVLNYFGQGALVLQDPSAIDSPFYRMVPDWAVLPMVVLACVATVIASQAVISGAFSITAQAMRMGYLPRLKLVQTSGEAMGQIYLPAVNWLSLAGVIVLVAGFGTSTALSSAYGIAVSVTMVTTTLLAIVVALRLWRWPWLWVAAGGGILLAIDLLFLAANTRKIADGGWLPLLVAAVVMLVFTTWARGRAAIARAAAADRVDLEAFIGSLAAHPPHRVNGTAVFLSSAPDAVPHALLHNLKHNQVLHQHVIVLRVESCDTPRVSAAERIHAEQLPLGFWRVTARHGFMESSDVPAFIGIFSYQKGVPAEKLKTSYFTSRESVGKERIAGMSWLTQGLFRWLHRNAGRPSDYFNLPGNRVVELGRRAT